jgi:hypothetical protein
MNKEDNKEQFIKWLRSLSDKQFVEFFYEVVKDRNTSDIEKWNGHFILSDTECVENEEWETDHIALHDPQECPEGWADDVPICQSGTCSSCGAEVRSWAKHAICSICKNKVYCT